MTKFKITEVIGKKLNPNARYLFVFDGNEPVEQVRHFNKEMTRILGHNNFMVTLVNGDPRKKFTVFEIKEPIGERKAVPKNIQPENTLIHVVPKAPKNYELPVPQTIEDGGFDHDGVLLSTKKYRHQVSPIYHDRIDAVYDKHPLGEDTGSITREDADRGPVNFERSENEA